MSNGNSPAFPCQDKDKQIWTGMNLRDYFALEALNAMLQRDDVKVWTHKSVAEHAYLIADAMLEERVKYP